MTLMVFNLSYFLGMSWVILNCLYEELYLGIDFGNLPKESVIDKENYFLSAYELENRENKDVCIIATYFA